MYLHVQPGNWVLVTLVASLWVSQYLLGDIKPLLILLESDYFAGVSFGGFIMYLALSVLEKRWEHEDWRQLIFQRNKKNPNIFFLNLRGFSLMPWFWNNLSHGFWPSKDIIMALRDHRAKGMQAWHSLIALSVIKQLDAQWACLHVQILWEQFIPK